MLKFHQIIADIAKRAFPKDTKFWDIDIKEDVKNLKHLMSKTVHGFPFESSQEIGMDVKFRSELTSFLQRYKTPIVNLTGNPEKVIVDVTNSNI